MPVKGTDEVLRNINAAVKKMKGNVEAGLLFGAGYLKKESQKLTPVVTSYLRNSAYVKPYKKRKKVGAEVGYTADYAVYVHEDAEKEKRRAARRGTPHPKGRVIRSHVGYWKFLETPLKEKSRQIIAIIREAAKKSFKQHRAAVVVRGGLRGPKK